jgi:hypothetical protein
VTADARSIALVLTTRDRRWELLRLFDSLAGQSNTDFVVRLGDQRVEKELC